MKPYQFTRFLILATAKRRYPFALLGAHGLVAYFASREDAVSYILGGAL